MIPIYLSVLPLSMRIIVESHIMEDVKLNLEAIKAFTEGGRPGRADGGGAPVPVP